MPISSYPRLGHPLAPRLLARYLQGRASFCADRFCDLDASAWERWGLDKCWRLGPALVGELAPQCTVIEQELGAVVLVPADGRVTLDRLELETRTFNCLGRANLADRPPGVARLTLAEALALRQFGIQCLVDLLTSLEAVGAPVATVPEALPQLVLRHKDMPPGLLHCVLPPLPPGLRLHQLGLKPRTLHGLVKSGLADDPAELARLTVRDALRLKGFGLNCLLDLVESLYHANGGGSPPAPGGDSCGEPRPLPLVPRDLRRLVEDLGEIPRRFHPYVLPALPAGCGLHDLRLPLRLFNPLAAAGYADHPSVVARVTVADLLRVEGFGPQGLVELVEAAYRCAEAGAAAARTLEQEVLDRLVPGREKRKQDMMASYYGMWGRPRRTLESIGDEFGLSRERIRQLATPRRRPGESLAPLTPALGAALALIRDTLPAPAVVIEKDLVARGLLEPATSLECVHRVTSLWGHEPGFVIEGEGAARTVDVPVDAGVLSHLLGLIPHVLRTAGVTTVDFIRQTASPSPGVSVPAGVIGRVLRYLPGLRWLDESAGWFWLDDGRPNALRRRLQKILSVAPKVTVVGLRAALRRSNRDGRVAPPLAVLAEFCRQLPECTVRGTDVCAVSRGDPLRLLHGDERRLVQILLERGPFCQRAEFIKRAQQAGVSTASFWHCVGGCGTITRYAPDVYGVTGADARPELLQALVSEQFPARGLRGHGRTKEGRIWIAYRLSDTIIAGGVLGVPEEERPLVQGEFTLCLPSGEVVGTLSVQGPAAWGLEPFFRQASVEAGDLLLLEIDLKTRRVLVQVGDEGLPGASAE